ncbi:MAG: hypothetical protein ACO4CZ_14950, partial [Planctomycetota bacterium]
MKELSPDDLSYLSRFGFDPDLFASWRQALREGRLSAAGNIVQGKMLAPLDGSIHDMPKQGSPERANLDALGEVHDLHELERALGGGARTIGVNARDLRTFEVDPGRFAAIAAARPEGTLLVAESGGEGPAAVARLGGLGADAVR